MSELAKIALAEIADQDFENLDQAQQLYVTTEEVHEEARFVMARVSKRVRDRMGKAGLNGLAQTTHRKRSTLEAEARVAELADLREDRPTLTFLHFGVVSRMARAEAERWLDDAADNNLSPADLRRRIAAERRQPETSDVVVKKADAVVERGKSVVDQAAELGVLDEVDDRILRLVEYAAAKAKE